MGEGGAGLLTLTTLPHQLLRQTQPPVRPHHAQARDMPMLNVVDRLLFHLGQNVSDDPRGFVWGLLRPRDIHGHIRELRPGKGMIEIVFEKVVFGEVGDVGGLDVGNIRRSEHADVHLAKGLAGEGRDRKCPVR